MGEKGDMLMKGKISIKKIIIINLICLIVISNIIVYILSITYFEKLTYDNVQEHSEENLLKTIEMIQLKLEYQYQMSWSILNNSELQDLLVKSSNSLITMLDTNEEVRNMFINYSTAMDYIESINIYGRNLTLDTANQGIAGQESLRGYGLINYSIYEKYISNQKLYPYKDNFNFNQYYARDLGKNMIMSLHLLGFKGNQETGVLAITVSADYLFSHIQKLKEDEEKQVFIVDKKGNYIYKEDEKGIYDDFNEYDFAKQILKEERGIKEVFINEKKSVVSFQKFDKIDWIVVEIINYEYMLKDFYKVNKSIFLLTCLILGIAILIGLFITGAIIKPLNKLVEKFKSVQSGNLQTDIIESNKIIEINMLNENFNYMVYKIQKLVKEVDEAHQLQRRYELKALQAQINPHFLYNTLDAVYWMTDNEVVANITDNLAKFFRISLSKGKDDIPVEKEMEQVRAYINIQLIRFEGKFTYEEDIEKEIKSCKMIKLVIQPLVENAILHGLEYMRKGGEIVVSGGKVGTKMVITVEDNGIGVDVEAMNQYLQQRDSKDTKGYGVKNVHERIQLRYGKEYGLLYENRKNGGTKVIINLPSIFDNREVGKDV